jgi:nitrate/nitrite transporter NarK
LLAVVLGFVSPFILEDHPEKANWLSAQEKQRLLRDLANNQQPAEHHGSFRETLANLNIWLLSIIYFLLVAGLYGVSFWLPQIVHDFGQSSLVITGLLSSIPYLCATVGMILIAGYSDRSGERYRTLLSCAVLGAIGLAGSAFFHDSVQLALLSLSVACIGVMSSFTVFWTIPPRLLSNQNSTAAAGIAMINSIGSLGGYVGPFMLGWIKDTTHSLNAGLYTLAVAVILTNVFWVLLRRRAVI